MKRECIHCAADLSHRKVNIDYCNAICRTRHRLGELDNERSIGLTPEQISNIRWKHISQNSSQEAMMELAGLKVFKMTQAETCAELFALRKG